MPGVPGGNYNISDYASTGALSYFLASTNTFYIGGTPYPVLTSGTSCGLGPCYLLSGGQVYIGLPPCAATAAQSGKHLDGVVLVNDYTSMVVMPDGGTLFKLDPAWLSHFLGVIGFVPLPA